MMLQTAKLGYSSIIMLRLATLESGLHVCIHMRHSQGEEKFKTAKELGNVSMTTNFSGGVNADHPQRPLHQYRAYVINADNIQ